jgi:hypothetical protein
MKRICAVLFPLFLLFLCGCKKSDNPVQPGPVLPIHQIVVPGDTLISGFFGADTVSAIGENSFKYPLPQIADSLYDTIEISFTYSHYGVYQKLFEFSLASFSGGILYEITWWQDTLMRGTRSMVMRMASTDFQRAAFTGYLVAEYDFEPPTNAPPDSTYMYDLEVVGFANSK